MAFFEAMLETQMLGESSDHRQQFRAVNVARTKTLERNFKLWMISIAVFYSSAKSIGMEDYQLSEVPEVHAFIKFSFPNAIYWLRHTNYPILAAAMWIFMIVTTPIATVALLRAIGILNVRSHPRTVTAIVLMFTAFAVFGYMDPMLNAERPHGILGRLYTREEVGVALLPALVGISVAVGTAYGVSYLAYVFRACRVALSKLTPKKVTR